MDDFRDNSTALKYNHREKVLAKDTNLEFIDDLVTIHVFASCFISIPL